MSVRRTLAVVVAALTVLVAAANSAEEAQAATGAVQHAQSKMSGVGGPHVGEARH